MSLPLPKKQVTLFFHSPTVLSQFKQESACMDFYIDRDACAVVGFFTDEQVLLALTKYEARRGAAPE